MADFKYEIKKNIEVLSEGKNGWTKEVNLVSWNGKPAKLDIRDWNHEECKMGKGVTLTYDEAQLLKEALEYLDF